MLVNTEWAKLQKKKKKKEKKAWQHAYVQNFAHAHATMLDYKMYKESKGTSLTLQGD